MVRVMMAVAVDIKRRILRTCTALEVSAALSIRYGEREPDLPPPTIPGGYLN
jgi:hypothetical protein